MTVELYFGLETARDQDRGQTDLVFGYDQNEVCVCAIAVVNRNMQTVQISAEVIQSGTGD